MIGNVNVDVLLGDVPTWPMPGSEVLAERYELRVGGAAGNTALALAAMGASAEVVAGVGDDAMGVWLQQGLRPAGVALEVMASSTALTVGLSHPDGERTFVSHLGHLSSLPRAAIDAALRRSRPGDLLLFCGYFMMRGLRAVARELLEDARSRGLRTLLDPGWPTEGWTDAVRDEIHDLLPLLDTYLPNLEELYGTTGATEVEAAVAALDQGRVVVKLGAAGALLAERGTLCARVPAPAVRVQDTVGAGDTFNAGLLAGLQRRMDWGDALAVAASAASLAVASAPRRYPTWAEVEIEQSRGLKERSLTVRTTA